jgi:hypothetical protein
MASCSDSPSILDIASFSVATLAFLATFWQGWVARKHNRHSVTPMIVQHTETNINDTGITVNFAIRNAGVGPAIVTDRYFSIGGTKFIQQNQSDVIKDLCAQLIGKSLDYRIISSGMFGMSAKLPAGSEFKLLTLFFPGLHPDSLPVVDALTSKADFVVEYKSIYGEPFTYSSSK